MKSPRGGGGWEKSEEITVQISIEDIRQQKASARDPPY
jgi:hypothetical protein